MCSMKHLPLSGQGQGHNLKSDVWDVLVCVPIVSALYIETFTHVKSPFDIKYHIQPNKCANHVLFVFLTEWILK